MIKKLLTMSAGIVLGCMFTTASFAGSPDCNETRDGVRCIIGLIQNCKAEDPNCAELSDLRMCKVVSRSVQVDVCYDGTYTDADPDEVVFSLGCLANYGCL